MNSAMLQLPKKISCDLPRREQPWNGRNGMSHKAMKIDVKEYGIIVFFLIFTKRLNLRNIKNYGLHILFGFFVFGSAIDSANFLIFVS